jgi:hypothetical protein
MMFSQTLYYFCKKMGNNFRPNVNLIAELSIDPQTSDTSQIVQEGPTFKVVISYIILNKNILIFSPKMSLLFGPLFIWPFSVV